MNDDFAFVTQKTETSTGVWYVITQELLNYLKNNFGGEEKAILLRLALLWHTKGKEVLHHSDLIEFNETCYHVKLVAVTYQEQHWNRKISRLYCPVEALEDEENEDDEAPEKDAMIVDSQDAAKSNVLVFIERASKSEANLISSDLTQRFLMRVTGWIEKNKFEQTSKVVSIIDKTKSPEIARRYEIPISLISTKPIPLTKDWQTIVSEPSSLPQAVALAVPMIETKILLYNIENMIVRRRNNVPRTKLLIDLLMTVNRQEASVKNKDKSRNQADIAIHQHFKQNMHCVVRESHVDSKLCEETKIDKETLMEEDGIIEEDIASFSLLFLFCIPLLETRGGKLALRELANQLESAEKLLFACRLRLYHNEEQHYLECIEREKLETTDCCLKRVHCWPTEAETLFQNVWPSCTLPTVWFKVDAFLLLDRLCTYELFVSNGEAYLCYKHFQSFYFAEVLFKRRFQMISTEKVKTKLLGLSTQSEVNFQRFVAEQQRIKNILLGKRTRTEVSSKEEEDEQEIDDGLLSLYDLFQEAKEVQKYLEHKILGLQHALSQTAPGATHSSQMDLEDLMKLSNVKRSPIKIPMCAFLLLNKCDTQGSHTLKDAERFQLTGFLFNSGFRRETQLEYFGLSIVAFDDDEKKGAQMTKNGRHLKTQKLKELDMQYLASRKQNENTGYAERNCGTLISMSVSQTLVGESGCPFVRKSRQELDQTMMAMGITHVNDKARILTTVENNPQKACSDLMALLHNTPRFETISRPSKVFEISKRWHNTAKSFQKK
jgi:hypothetical protein